MQINFNRKFFVKDLLSYDSLTQSCHSVEFNTFLDFVSEVLHKKTVDISKASKVIIPVSSAAELTLALSIQDNVCQTIILYLKDISQTTLEAFNSFNCKSLRSKKRLMLDYQLIDVFWDSILNKPIKGLIDFMSYTAGVSRINVDNTTSWEDLAHSFLKCPFFCNLDIIWNWKSLEDQPLSSFKSLDYFLSLLKYNMFQKKQSIDWTALGKENNYSSYLYTFPNEKVFCRKLLIKEGCAYVENDTSCKTSKVILDNSSNADLVNLKELDTTRSWYDAKFTDSCSIVNKSLISLSQNYVVWGCPSMIPYSTKIVDKILQGDF